MNIKHLIVLSITTLSLSACYEEDGKVTGGGSIESSSGSGKANYGFNGSDCDGNLKGNFNYHDRAASVKIKGELSNAGLCTDTEQAGVTVRNDNCYNYCSDGDYILEFDYNSRAQFVSGEGTGIACLTDGGEGKGASDKIGVHIITGPSAGYVNIQEASRGNIQGHACPASKSNKSKK